MRIVFAGTPEAAVPALRHLAASGHEIALVITRPDAPQGRKRTLTPSPVADAADSLGLPVLKTARLDDAATAEIVATGAELGVIVAYGGLVREPLLNAFDHGWINLHFSALPAWRGAAPVQRALIAGDDELGWAVFRLVAALDAGDVYEQHAYRPGPDDTAADVLVALAEIGGAALGGIVSAVGSGQRAVAQSGEVTHAAKLTFADGRLDPTETAAAVYARYRGVTNEPGAHVSFGGTTLKVGEMARANDVPRLDPGEVRMIDRRVLMGTATDSLELVRVQPAGKQSMAASDWWRGLRTERAEVTR